MLAALPVSERRACRLIGQSRSTQRYAKHPADDEELLRQRVVDLASQYGRYGYCRVSALLRREGWLVNHKPVQRIWRQEGLKVSQKQPKHGRLWLNDGSVVRLRPEFPKHVWSYDFMQDRTPNGVPFRILNVIDEYTRECLAFQRRLRVFGKKGMDKLKTLHRVSGKGDEGSFWTP